MPASTTSPPVHESLLTRTQVSEAASSGTRPPRAPTAQLPSPSVARGCRVSAAVAARPEGSARTSTPTAAPPSACTNTK